MLYPNWNWEATRSSGPDPVTGPGDVGRVEKGLRDVDLTSLDPSTKTAIEGDGGLFEAEE
jgi:hypothetical protein